MATLFELCANEKSQQILKKIKERQEERQEEEQRERREQIDNMHKKSHIFTDYGEALDFILTHKEYGLHCHGMELYAKSYGCPSEKDFLSFETEFDYDGVNCWNVRRFYTKQEVLDNVEEIKELFAKRFPEEPFPRYDKWGKLEDCYLLV